MSSLGADPLLAGLAAGGEEAFAALYDRYGGALYRTALGLLGRREDAEDAVQEVLTAMVRSRRKLGEVRDLTAYLFASLRRSAGRLAARRARQPAGAPQAVEDAAAGGPAAPGDPREHRLERAVRALPDEQQVVIALKINGGLTFAQIAEVVGVPANTAASRYRYALQKLRDMLRENGT
jgi:RNA polymerase sigma-70 factor (ECF subfamily)